MKSIALKSLLTLAISATLLASTALYAQQEPFFNPELGNGRWAAVEPPVSPAVNDGSYFNAETGVLPAIEEFVRQGPAEHAIRAGKARFESPRLLADVELPAGRYDYKVIQAGEAQLIEFSQIVTDNYAAEGLSPYQRQVIARVSATPEILAAAGIQPKTSSTMAALMPSSAGK